VYAVIEDSGQQFRVSEGDVLTIDLRELKPNAKKLTFDRVLLIADNGDVKLGTPLVEGAKVSAEILDHDVKGEKVHIYKHRRRKASRRKTGHRQKYVQVRITGISG
jgi:large subunit ribosomal protein L21